ncbi:MAG: hypothetical protein ACKVQB_05170 [Bacteroidia bacterium]
MKNKVLNLSMAFLMLVSIMGCEKEGEGACKAGIRDHAQICTPRIENVNYNALTFTDNGFDQIYYLSVFGKAQFFMESKLNNICTKTHFKPSFSVRMSDTTLTHTVKIYAQAYWSTYDEQYIMFNDIPTAGQIFNLDADIGLKQAFNDGPGDIQLYLNVEFTSFGSAEADKRYFERIIAIMESNCTFDKSS